MAEIQLLACDAMADTLSAERCRPIGWIFSSDYQQRATCFLIHDYWIATAGHVFMRAADAADAIVVFNYLDCVPPHERDAYALRPEDGFITEYRNLDFCLVRLRPRGGSAVPPGQRWGVVNLAGAAEVATGTPLVSVQHSDLFDYKCFSTGKVERHDHPLFVHTAPASGGTSGAPLLDRAGRLVGIHQGERVAGKYWSATPATSVLRLLTAMTTIPSELSAIVSPG